MTLSPAAPAADKAVMALAGPLLLALAASPQAAVGAATEGVAPERALHASPFASPSAVADALALRADLVTGEDEDEDATRYWAYRHGGGALDLEALTGPLLGQGLAHRHGIEGRMRQERSLRFGLARLDETGSGLLVDVRSGPLGFPEDRVESHVQVQRGFRVAGAQRVAARLFHRSARAPEEGGGAGAVAAAADAQTQATADDGASSTGGSGTSPEGEDLLGVGGRWSRADAFVDLSAARRLDGDSWRGEIAAGWSWSPRDGALGAAAIASPTPPVARAADWRLSVEVAWRHDGAGAGTPQERLTALFLVTVDA